LRCPVCGKTKRNLNALKQHARRAHKVGNEELFERIHGVDVLCGCGKRRAFISIESGFDEKCKACLVSSGVRPTRSQRISDSLIGHPVTEEARKKIAAAHIGKATTTGVPAWSRGLTKHIDERLARAGRKTSVSLKARYADPQTPPWMTGLTAETDERIKKIAEAVAATFKAGRRGWSYGLTKETDDRLARMSMLARVSQDEIRRRLQRFEFELLEDDVRIAQLARVRHSVCGTEQIRTPGSVWRTRGMCPHCNPYTSRWQLDIFEFVKSIDPTVAMNVRSVIAPLELDIWSASSNFAIECNGLYWHSMGGNGNEWIHALKTKKCLEQGIRLLHLFEDEWFQRREIVESMIKNKMNVPPPRRLFARDLVVGPVASKESRDFFGHNHLDGGAKSSVTIGLYSDDELVSAMSLRTPHHRRWKEWGEVSRFATAIDTHVVGGFSRLTNHALRHSFLDDKRGLMSYVDTRHGDGHSYEVSGWNFCCETRNRFWWTDYHDRINRFMIRATEEMTEAEVAIAAGLTRIYGCPNKIYTIAR